MSVNEIDKEIARLQEERRKALGDEQDKNLRLNGAVTRPLFNFGITDVLSRRYSIYAALLVVVVVLSYCGVTSIQRTSKEIGVAEEKERTAKVDDKAVAEFKRVGESETEGRAQQRTELAKQNEKRHTAKIKRNVKIDKAIGAVTAPKPAHQVAQDVKDILGIEPSIGGEDTLSYTAAQVQSWVALKLDRDRLSENLADTLEQLRNKEQEVALLEKDNQYKTEALLKTEQQAKDWRDVALSYKTVAKKSGFKKFLSFGKTVGQIGLTALIVGLVAR